MLRMAYVITLLHYVSSQFGLAGKRGGFVQPAYFLTYYDRKQKFADGYYDRKVKRRRRRKIDREKIRQAMAEKPDAYLRELAQQFSCTATAVFYMLGKLGISLKKKPSPTARGPRGSARSSGTS